MPAALEYDPPSGRARLGVVAGESSNQTEQGGSSGSNLVGGLVLLAIALGLFFLVCGLVPADLPPDKNANFIDSIFHNKGVVLAARLLLVSAAVVLAMGGVFIMVSMAIRMKNGEWLKRAGPFEIGEAELSDIETQIENGGRPQKRGRKKLRN